MPNHRRTWTRREDELIRNQPTTGISLWKLEKLLRAKTETIEYRAQQLGIELHHYTKKFIPKKSKRIKVPKKDPLLARLKRFHPELRRATITN
jgi:hypothetical protein